MATEATSSAPQPSPPAAAEATSVLTQPAAPAMQESISTSVETSPPFTTSETLPISRRCHRSTAFFEPKVDDDEDKNSPPSPGTERKSSTPSIITPESTATPPTTSHILFALPLLILLFIYSLSPFSDLIVPDHHTQTPLTPLLSSLSNLTTLSPALPYTGLATHVLVRNMTALPDVPSDLMILAQKAKTLVEEFSGEEDLFQRVVMEGLEDLQAVEKWTEEGMREGYVGFFEGVEKEGSGLVKRTGELKGVLEELGGEMGGFEGLGKVVGWVGMVFGKADERYKYVVEEARKGRESLGGVGKGWMSEGLLERGISEIKQYHDTEKEAREVLEGISKEYMESETQGMVEGKLEAAIIEERMDWW